MITSPAAHKENVLVPVVMQIVLYNIRDFCTILEIVQMDALCAAKTTNTFVSGKD